MYTHAHSSLPINTPRTHSVCVVYAHVCIGYVHTRTLCMCVHHLNIHVLTQRTHTWCVCDVYVRVCIGNAHTHIVGVYALPIYTRTNTMHTHTMCVCMHGVCRCMCIFMHTQSTHTLCVCVHCVCMFIYACMVCEYAWCM